ncbi:MAG: acyl-CoA desaturase [Chloroflexi bacterium]|nr:acyl-CoA desaturase [Chloroflexota bacterium]
MFEHLKGGISSPSATSYSSFGQRFTQLMTLVLLLGPLGASIYALTQLIAGNVSTTDLVLLGAFYGATSMGVTVGFHRMLTHNAFEAHPALRAVLLVFGTWSVQGAAISWAAIHQKHHVKSDTSDDPHSPTRSFLHAHMGWLMHFDRAELDVYAKTQLKDPITMFISRTAFWWVVLGLVIPFLIGGWSGLLWGGMVRIFLVHHITWSVNSVCHIFGSRPYKISGSDQSTNNWVVGLLAMGEGWHNNHHAFPRSAFHGLRPWEIDVSGYVIRVLGVLRLAKNIYRVPQAVLHARAAAAPERHAIV